MTNFKKINLNLLLHLHALLTERGVSAAADKVFISQPAMSTSLKNLRAIFKDPLLIVNDNGYFLSAKAELLRPQLELLMLQIQTILTPIEKFDPKKSKRIFKLALPDYIELLLLPSLLDSLTQFPNIVIETRINASSEKPALFIEKNIDIVIGALDEHTGLSQLKMHKLFEEKLVCFASQNNPLINKPLSLSQYLESRHLAFSFNEQHYSSSAEFLRKKKFVRHDVMYVNNILPALFAVANTASVLSIAPRVLVETFATQLGLSHQPLPFDLAPIPIYLITHSKDETDEGIQWLSALITEKIQRLICFPT